MQRPINKYYNIDEIPEQGRFGGQRKFDTHTGVDLYCDAGESVYAIESGVIINKVKFTGKDAESPWWLDTDAILVEGESGVILYGELNILETLSIGAFVTEGQKLGEVSQVLKTDKGLPMCMLHIELYETGYRNGGEWWRHKRPEGLLNVEQILKKVYRNDT